MANPNPNDTKFEQQRSDAATEALKEQTKNNDKKDNEQADDTNVNEKEDNK